MKDEIQIFESRVNFEPKIYQLLKSYSESGDSSVWREWSKILVSAHDDEVDYPKNNIKFLEFDKEAFIVTGDGNHRQSTKLGRAIRQILLAVRPDVNLDKQGREFGDFIQFLQGRLSSIDDLELVSGPKIAKYYKKENTVDFQGSEICKSCMVGKPDSVFDIYTQNPDSVSLLVRLKGGKVSARALVWKLAEPSDCIYLDRIYSVVNSERELGQFQEFLQIKFPGKKIFYHNQLGIDRSKFRVELTNSLFKKYPYLDTFYYLHLEYERYRYFDGIIKRAKDFFKKEKKETSRLDLSVRAINRGFLTSGREEKLEEGRLVFQLRNHLNGIKEPKNCKVLDSNNHVFRVSASKKEAIELLDSGKKLSKPDLIAICRISINFSDTPNENDKILMRVLDRFISERYYESFNRFLGDINSNDNLLLTIKKYKKWINSRGYQNIRRRLRDSNFREKFLEIYPEGFDKYLFFYLDHESGFNIDKKYLNLRNGYKPYGTFDLWSIVNIEFLFFIRKDFYIELFFDDLSEHNTKDHIYAFTKYYTDKQDIERVKLILGVVDGFDKLWLFTKGLRDGGDGDNRLFKELYNPILDKCAKYLNMDELSTTQPILDYLCYMAKYDQILPSKIFDDLYSKGLDGKILNIYIKKNKLNKDDELKIYPEKPNLDVKKRKSLDTVIKKFKDYVDAKSR